MAQIAENATRWDDTDAVDGLLSHLACQRGLVQPWRPLLPTFHQHKAQVPQLASVDQANFTSDSQRLPHSLDPKLQKQQCPGFSMGTSTSSTRATRPPVARPEGPGGLKGSAPGFHRTEEWGPSGRGGVRDLALGRLEQTLSKTPYDFERCRAWSFKRSLGFSAPPSITLQVLLWFGPRLEWLRAALFA